MNYDDLKKKLGIKVLPNQTPIVKVVEEEKLVEPAKPDTSSPIKIDQFKAQTQTSIKVEEEKVVEPSKSGAPASSPSIDPVKLLLGISFICVICVIFFINYISSPSDQELLYQEESYYRAVRDADSAAAARFADSEAIVSDSVAAIEAVVEATAQNVELQKGLIVYYPFNSNANDESGNGNNATVYGASLTTDRNGNPNSAYYFNGSRDYIRKSNISSINKNNGQELSVSLWIKPERLGGSYQDILANRDNTTLNWVFYQHTNYGALGFHGAAQNPSSYVPQLSTWINVVVVVNSNQTYKMYVNNALVQTVSNYSYSAKPGELTIGNFGNNQEQYKGSIDDIRIYNRAINESEIQALYINWSHVARVKDSSRDLKQAATQLENEKKLRIEAVKNFKRFDKKNLNVSKYRNGDAIPQVQDADAWSNLTTGAWCYYDNKKSYGTKYGKLYNWYAVNDPRGLAPKGYHIPTNEEWTTLTNYLGGETIAGTKMKSKNGWKDDGNGTNTSGFAGLPGGYRYSNGNFFNIGAIGNWWSSSESSTSTAWYRYLDNSSGSVDRNDNDKQDGFSVRCLRD